jgi:hypothetical protein
MLPERPDMVRATAMLSATGVPLMPVSVSPGASPAAAAGLPGTTDEMTAGSLGRGESSSRPMAEPLVSLWSFSVRRSEPSARCACAASYSAFFTSASTSAVDE